MQIKLANPNFTENYLKNLLYYRGVEDFDEYLNPNKDKLLEPELLDNIEAAKDLYFSALESGKPIALVVDSDCDGYTSSAIFAIYTHKIAPNTEIDFFLHTKKQHGLQDMWEDILAADKDYGLIVCPDSSSNDISYHSVLGNEKDYFTLVLDHHLLDEEISPYAVIVNNQISSKYTNKELTGAGVTWQFCRYIDKIRGTNYADDLIDLAALGVCGDMGSVLSMENRYLMKNGFENVKNKFFLALLDKQSYSMGGKINPTTIAFYIVPLINAMIRVGTQEEKERMFLAFIDGDKLVPCNKRGAKGTMEKVAIESTRECTNAKSRQNKILDANLTKIEMRIHKQGLLENKILIVPLEADDDFPSEINGLLAMKLSAKYKKPTIIVRENEIGYMRGSIRGVANSPLEDFKGFLESSNLCEYVSGHAQAAGISFPETKMDNLLNYANTELKEVNFNDDCYEVNFSRMAADEDLKDLIMDLGQYPEVWGKDNPEDKILITDLNITPADIQVIGARQDTLKIEKFGVVYIKFFAKDLIKELQEAGDDIKLNIVGHSNINEWGGRLTPQLFIDACEVLDGTYGF